MADTYYFTDTTEADIRAYVQETDKKKRNRIYQDRLYTPLKRLADSVFHNCKLVTDIPQEEAKSDCLTFLTGVLDRWNPEHGSKAFSYLAVIAQRYYYNASNKSMQHNYRYLCLSSNNNDNVTNVLDETSETLWTDTDVTFNHTKIIQERIAFWEEHFNTAFAEETDKYRIVAKAVLEMLHRPPPVNGDFGKHSVYRYIKAICGCTTSDITYTVNIIKTYEKLYAKKNEEEEAY